MQYNITTNLGVALSEKGFSLDELVWRMQTLFNEKAFPELLAEIIMLFDEFIRLHVMQGKPIPFNCGCGGDTFVLDGTRPRQIMTPIGKIVLKALTRVKCPYCGKTFVPVLEILGFDLYQTKSDGVEKLVAEQCIQTSYRRACRTIRELTAVGVSHETLRQWILKTDADEIHVPENVIGVLPTGDCKDVQPEPVTILADGSKCKARGDDGKAEQGDVKVVIGVRNDGKVFPVGTWAGHETWKDIGDELERRRVQFPEGSILVSDGEEGIAANLAKLANGNFQRCQWHTVRDLTYEMWLNGGKVGQVNPVKEKLKSILAIELPKESFEVVPDEEKKKLEERTIEAERKLNDLIGEVRQGGFIKAANYLEKAKSSMFSYVRRWLALGIACPRASSLIERTMRELARRIKRLAYNWKSEGLEKISKLLLKFFSSKEEWERYWRERMNLNCNVMLTFRMMKPGM